MRKKGFSEKRSFAYVVLFVATIVSLVALQHALTEFQKARYVKDVYDCSDMSSDCEVFFELLGIDTKHVIGINAKNNQTSIVSHEWLELDLLITKAYFESTVLRFYSHDYYQRNWGIWNKTDGNIESSTPISPVFFLISGFYFVATRIKWPIQRWE